METIEKVIFHGSFTDSAHSMFYEIFQTEVRGKKNHIHGLALGGDVSKKSKYENCLSHMNYLSSLLSKNLSGGSYFAKLLSN